jgi:hypothetical protein
MRDREALIALAGVVDNLLYVVRDLHEGGRASEWELDRIQNDISTLHSTLVREVAPSMTDTQNERSEQTRDCFCRSNPSLTDMAAAEAVWWRGVLSLVAPEDKEVAEVRLLRFRTAVRTAVRTAALGGRDAE